MRLDTLKKVVLVLGFLAVSAAMIVAYLSPATGYELSIYAGTPVEFWAFSTVALLVSIGVVFTSADRTTRALAAFLGGMTMTAIVALPIIRGYHYMGEADSLSHLGTAKEMNAGTMALLESPYPVVHTLGSVIHDVAGLSLEHALLVVVVVFVVVFFVFVPLVVWELTGDRWAAYIGLYSGLLLLPLNHLAPSHYIHPTSQAIMYAPAFLFLFFVLYRYRNASHSLLFLLVSVTFVLLHPQQAANLVIFFGVIAAMQVGDDVRRGYETNRRREWVLPEVTFYAAVFFSWAATLDIFWRNLERVYMIPFEGFRVAESTATRGVSLAAVGGSLPEVFAKLFLVTTVYVVLTALLMVLVVRRTRLLESRATHDVTAPDGGTDEMLPLFIFVGLVAVTFIFVAYLVGGISDQYFRHLGMLMVFATILGAIALGRIMRFVGRRRSWAAGCRSVALVLVLCLLLSLPVVFASPYIYAPSDHVTRAQMYGYETAFEHRVDSMAFEDVRSETVRYGDAIQGKQLSPSDYYMGADAESELNTQESAKIPDHFVDQSLRTYYEQAVYVPVTEADRTRDPVLWNGFRFSDDDFEYLDTEPGIDRVQTSNGYDLYVVHPVNGSSG